MDGRGATTESSLSDGASLLSISAAIEQHHLHGSISSSKKFSNSQILDKYSLGSIWSFLFKGKRGRILFQKEPSYVAIKLLILLKYINFRIFFTFILPIR